MKLLPMIAALLLAGSAAGAEESPTPRLRGFTMPDAPQHLKAAKEAGGNAVRLMTRPKVKSAPDGGYTLDISHIETFLDAAKEAGVAVIIDLHDVPNPNRKNYRSDRVGSKADFWKDDGNLEFMIRFWTQVAELCKDRPGTIWFDLCNEPLNWEDMPSYPKKWPLWAQTLIDRIRRIDTVHEIVIEPGPGGLCWGFREFPKLKGDRLIYSVHNYQPHAYTHQGISSLENTDLAKAYLETNLGWPGSYGDSGGGLWNKERLKRELAPAREFQLKHNVRMYVGEFGVVRWAPNAERYLRDNLEIFEEYGWNWTYHAFREHNCWSFEHKPVFGKTERSETPTATARVMREFLDRNAR